MKGKQAEKAQKQFRLNQEVIRKKQVSILKERFKNYYKNLDIGRVALKMDLRDVNRNLLNPITEKEVT